MKRVYLAGSIYKNPDARPWRLAAKEMLPKGWTAVDPFDFEVGKLLPSELVNLDYGLIRGCDALIANVQAPSWGTAMELAFAKRERVPIIGWARQVDGLESPWLVAHVPKIYPTLMEACMELANV
jgi:nucleoside 2-deoxyribosyltransferase